ncbi:hypothetical protein ACFLRO_01840 [Bacteroidota bacterium]
MILNQDFKESFALLNKYNVRYLIVEGYAVAYHDHPRYAKDIGVWIDNEQMNARALLQALIEFGFGSIGLKATDFGIPNRIIQLGNPPNRIDILTSLKGVEFGGCYRSREAVEIDNAQLYFIGLKCLKTNKVALGRHQDLADLENLE